jgi:5-formyltetrahydrofolate cyclo-ligase
MSLNSKTPLRAEIRRRLEKMTPEQRAADSLRACSLLEGQLLWRRAQSILFYAPMLLEIDIWQLLRDSLAAGKRVALPRFNVRSQQYDACVIRNLTHDLVAGQFGIREPAQHCSRLEMDQLEMVLAPGVAFDRQGRRLGRGKGFYDRLLSNAEGKACGVAFNEQLVETIPVEAHDRRVQWLLTPTQWLEFPGQ